MNREVPDVALLISSFERPAHLLRCLQSVALQAGVAGRFEVVVSDDGSRDVTPAAVRAFAASAPFPVRFVTRPHAGFRLAACRNAGVRASTAPYLLFLDGDCLLPPDHLRIHLAQRRPGRVNGSDCLRLGRAASGRVDAGVLRSGAYRHWASRREHLRLWREHWDARLNGLLRHPHKPKLFGNNIALWRTDLERVNGFDERFRGWGGEDDDLRLRLRDAGLAIRSLRHLTRTWHLWHPPHPSAPARYRDGVNVSRVERGFRLTRCLDGLAARDPWALDVRVVNPQRWPWGTDSLPPPRATDGPPELEILVLPGAVRRFSGEAQCNLLVATQGLRGAPPARTHLVIAPPGSTGFEPRLPLVQEPLAGLWELL